MKQMVFVIAGICAAAAGFLLWGGRRTPNVEQMAHTLEEAWADHHTVA